MMDNKDIFVDCDCDHVWVECSHRPAYSKAYVKSVCYICDKCGRMKTVEEEVEH